MLLNIGKAIAIKTASELSTSLSSKLSSRKVFKFIMSEFYKLAPVDKKGQPFPFDQLKGKVVLIVNVASKCGFTPQYKELEALYKRYKDGRICQSYRVPMQPVWPPRTWL